jgi:hypothetical protein
LLCVGLVLHHDHEVVDLVEHPLWEALDDPVDLSFEDMASHVTVAVTFSNSS